MGVGSSQRRATIQEAARIMGVSEGAVRKRVKRGTIAHGKGEGGASVRLPGHRGGRRDRRRLIP